MKNRKTVSDKQRAANRANGKGKSTGPRTERGKNASKFNAVKLGLFAKHIVIPLCDGEGSTAEFKSLLDDLQKEFEPEGPSEAFWVVQIAESMWKIRRANVAEEASINNAAKEGEPHTPDKLIDAYRDEGAVLKKAQEEIRSTGTLSEETHSAVCFMLKRRHFSTAKGKLNTNLELCRVQRTEEFVHIYTQLAEQMAADFLAAKALLPEATMTSILRCHKAAQTKLDWALQKLLESQQRRRKAQAQGV